MDAAGRIGVGIAGLAGAAALVTVYRSKKHLPAEQWNTVAAQCSSPPPDSNRVQQALLNSVAHNVRTPLASIIGVLSALQEDHDVFDTATRRELIETARQEAERLNRLLGNLLDLSRIESGALHVRSERCDVQDLIGAALEQLGSTARNRTIRVNIADDVPLVPMDFVLIVQALVNLVENAIKYSAPRTPVVIEARRVGDELDMCVCDEGDGIAEENLITVFQKFNRAGRTGETAGIGLGLSIARALIEAHQGSIRAERRSPQGTMFVFRLPLQTQGGVRDEREVRASVGG